MAFFVATFVHALGSALLLIFDTGLSAMWYMVAWLWDPIPMVISRYFSPKLDNWALYMVLFSWSFVVGCAVGFFVPLKQRFFPRTPRAPKSPRPHQRYNY